MWSERRGAVPVISVILLVAIVVILAAIIAVAVLGFTEDVDDPAPNVAQISSEFDAGGERENQIVRLTHVVGDDIPVETLEIVVRAPDCNTEARLVNLPSTESSRLVSENIRGDEDLIDTRFGTAELIVDDGTDTWTTGGTIEFRVAVAGCDFREDGNERLDVVLVHTESNAILFDGRFTT